MVESQANNRQQDHFTHPMVKYMGFVRDCLHEVDRKLETSPSKLSESTKKLSLIVPHCAEVEYAINIGRVQLTAIEYNIG